MPVPDSRRGAPAWRRRAATLTILLLGGGALTVQLWSGLPRERTLRLDLDGLPPDARLVTVACLGAHGEAVESEWYAPIRSPLSVRWQVSDGPALCDLRVGDAQARRHFEIVGDGLWLRFGPSDLEPSGALTDAAE